MKLTKKIKLLFIPIILFPMILVMVAFLTFASSYISSIYGPNAGLNSFQTMGNPMETICNLTDDEVNILRYTALNAPEKFDSKDFLDQVNQMLVENHAFLLINKDGNWTYQGEADIDEELLTEIANYNTENRALSFILETPVSCFVRCQQFSFEDGTVGTFYVVAYLGNMMKSFQRILYKLLFTIILVMLLTNILITVFMYRNFVRPVRVLKDGTNQIKDGNLNFEVEVCSDDELGELCESFNDMRLKLKDSVDTQMEFEKQNRELISNISHDLKTPITSIKGYVEGIMDGVADTPEKMDKYIKTIYNKTNEMDALINELSLYTQINSNQIPYNFLHVNLDAYFKDCIEDLNMDMERQGVELTFMNFCQPDIEIIADPEQLKRVINNIVFNAVKYKKDGKCRVDIRIRKIEIDRIRVEIEDNGSGISEEDLPNIFQRTYRADTARRSQGGSGLGLSICKKIIEEHGGSIWANSKKDVGTTMYFTLCIYDAGVDQTENAAVLSSLGKEKMLDWEKERDQEKEIAKEKSKEKTNQKSKEKLKEKARKKPKEKIKDKIEDKPRTKKLTKR